MSRLAYILMLITPLALAQNPFDGPSGGTYGLGYPFPDHGYGWDYGPPPAHHPHWTGSGWRNWNRAHPPATDLYVPSPPKTKYPYGSGLGGFIGRDNR